jgi:hypothetical protein
MIACQAQQGHAVKSLVQELAQPRVAKRMWELPKRVVGEVV